MRMPTRLHAAVAASCLAATAGAWAQTPAGPEFQVNVATAGQQRQPSVGGAADGRFVVAWGGDGDGSGHGAFARRYDATGLVAGAEFQVNTFTGNNQAGVPDVQRVAFDARGNFVVVWTGYGDDGSEYGVFGRRFDAFGGPRGSEFRVNQYTTNSQFDAAVSMAPDGRFVVAWASYLQDGSGAAVMARRYSADGSPIGDEVQLNTFTTNSQHVPAVAMDASGGFVIAWSDGAQDGNGAGIVGTRVHSSGAVLVPPFVINTFTTGTQSQPSVAMDAAGNFVVVWQSRYQDGDQHGIYGQRFSAALAAQGGEFRVNVDTTSDQTYPSAAMDAAGNFVVVWQAQGGDGDGFGIIGRRYDRTGAPRGQEFVVNTYTTYFQFDPSMAGDAVGNFVVAWTSYDQDGDRGSVQAQRFGGLQPAALAVDAAGNGVFEPGESVVVEPAWRNVNGLPQAIGGTATSFSGPAGATYTPVDAAATYGTVASGDTTSCGSDCFTLQVTNTGIRPVLHWDAVLEETVTPDAQGQDKLWQLHLGNSFPDVPSTSVFYRFVETLLHRGATGGCGSGLFCPADATTRGAMAVFVLLAKEGAGYAAPPCAAAPFPDVPPSHPFCPFIAEVSRRGVVAGCGGGNYCPGQPVLRHQMAVFALATLDPTFTPPPCGATPRFPDVPASSVFCPFVEELARRGVVTGCGGGNYCPASPVTRREMAVFATGAFGLTLYGP
jgi:hypothetical protein